MQWMTSLESFCAPLRHGKSMLWAVEASWRVRCTPWLTASCWTGRSRGCQRRRRESNKRQLECWLLCSCRTGSGKSNLKRNNERRGGGCSHQCRSKTCPPPYIPSHAPAGSAGLSCGARLTRKVFTHGRGADLRSPFHSHGAHGDAVGGHHDAMIRCARVAEPGRQQFVNGPNGVWVLCMDNLGRHPASFGVYGRPPPIRSSDGQQPVQLSAKKVLELCLGNVPRRNRGRNHKQDWSEFM